MQNVLTITAITALFSSEGSKFHGARAKYTSRSQHSQLALASHLTLATTEKALLEILSCLSKK